MMYPHLFHQCFFITQQCLLKARGTASILNPLGEMKPHIVSVIRYCLFPKNGSLSALALILIPPVSNGKILIKFSKKVLDKRCIFKLLTNTCGRTSQDSNIL